MFVPADRMATSVVVKEVLLEDMFVKGCQLRAFMDDLLEGDHLLDAVGLELFNLKGLRACGRDCKDKVREVAGEGLMRLVRFLDPMYSDKGERLRSKAAATIAHLATENEANAEAIVRLGKFMTLSHRLCM